MCATFWKASLAPAGPIIHTATNNYSSSVRFWKRVTSAPGKGNRVPNKYITVFGCFVVFLLKLAAWNICWRPPLSKTRRVSPLEVDRTYIIVTFLLVSTPLFSLSRKNPLQPNVWALWLRRDICCSPGCRCYFYGVEICSLNIAFKRIELFSWAWQTWILFLTYLALTGDGRPVWCSHFRLLSSYR